MRQRVLTAVGAVLCVGTLSAQTIVRDVDLSAFSWGIADARPVEVDGQPHTVEWLIRVTRFDTGYVWRIVMERPDGLCFGPWFAVEAPPFVTPEVMRVGPVDRLRVAFEPGRFREVRLDPPTTCLAP